MTAIRVLVAEDSPTVRDFLVELLSVEPGFAVVGQAADGKEAIRLCHALRPQVVTMDMMMPVMSGLAATEYLMAHQPTPILVLSASANRGEVFQTYEALAAGAVDVLEKPGPQTDMEAWRREFLALLRVVSRVRVLTHVRGRLRRRVSEPIEGARAAGPSEGPGVVAIGGSTGGPRALVEILSQVGDRLKLPVLVVLHLCDPFVPAFAEWLADQTGLAVELARDGMALPGPGQPVVFLAPAGRHLVVRDRVLRLIDEPERHFCRPSVDVLFESLARELGSAVIGCLLTGMGRDGAAGLRDLRLAGGRTLVQDEETSVVFGMPAAAIELGAAQHVLPLDRIAPALCSLANDGALPKEPP